MPESQNYDKGLAKQLREWIQPVHPPALPEAWRRKTEYSHVLILESKPSRLIEPASVVTAKFDRLAKEWQAASGATSSAVKIAMHPSYQKMIGLGQHALPLILRRLKQEGDEPNHWFWALAAISGENPVSKENRGRISQMARAWLAWGKERGYVELD